MLKNSNEPAPGGRRSQVLTGVLSGALLLLLPACGGEAGSTQETGAGGASGSGAELAAAGAEAVAASAGAIDAALVSEPAQKPAREPAPQPTERPARGPDAGVELRYADDDGHEHDAKVPSSPIKMPELPEGISEHEGARLMYEVGKGNHVFGRLMEGEVAAHTFDLVSQGADALIITQVKPTCGCTVATLDCENGEGEFVRYTFGDLIPSGRRIKLPATLHTKNKHGHQNVRINIFSNDPRGPIQLGLEADVDQFFNVTPRLMGFGRISIGEVQTQKAGISTAHGNPIALELQEQSLPGGASYELVPLNPDADGRSTRWELSVTLGPELVEQTMARALVLKSDVPIPGDDHKDLHGNAETYSTNITVSAQIVGPFSYQPNYISMGLVRPGQVVTRTVRLDCHDEDFDLGAHPPGLKIAGLPVPGGSGYQDWAQAESFSAMVRPVPGENSVDIEVRLEGLDDGATGSFRGTLVVALDHPEKKEITLVITGVCRGGPVPERGTGG